MPRVLIADDEASMRMLVARAIAMDGHDTVTAEDGAEALEILSREAGKFDLLLTDIQMPVMDGIALALSAARDFPDLTILLMTGFADQRERASGLSAIAHDVITKPFSVADIRAAVAGALPAAQFLQNAANPLHICFAGNLDRQIVAEFAAVQRPPQGIAGIAAVLLTADAVARAIALPVVIALLHPLRKLLGALAQG